MIAHTAAEPQLMLLHVFHLVNHKYWPGDILTDSTNPSLSLHIEEHYVPSPEQRDLNRTLV